MSGSISSSRRCATKISSRSRRENTGSRSCCPLAAKDFGKYEEPLAIDPYNGKFSLSAIALSNQIQPEAGMGGDIEADLLADRTPMIVNGMQVVPSGSNRFKKTDSVALYAQVYEPKLADPNPPTIRLAYRVVD